MDSKIKELRLKKSLTQENMAKALNISQNAYCLIENGKTRLVDVERIKIIAQKLDVEPYELGLLEDIGINVPYKDKVENGYTSSFQTINYENKELIQILKEQLLAKDHQIESLLKSIK